MLLILLKETSEYPNEVNSIELCFSKINQLLNNKEYVLSHLEIDGVEVYEEHIDYVTENIRSIQVIEIIVKTFKKMLDDTLIDLQIYLARATPETQTLADEFYKGPSNESWRKLSQLLEGLQWILQAIQPIYSLRNNELPYNNSLQYSIESSNLTDKISELETALNHEDMVLVADLIKYEILEILQKLQLEIQTTIDNEVVRNDLN